MTSQCTLTIPLNDVPVEVEFDFTKGYPATWDDPGCDDEADITAVIYKGVDVLPLINEDDMDGLYDYIYGYKGEDDV